MTEDNAWTRSFLQGQMKILKGNYIKLKENILKKIIPLEIQNDLLALDKWRIDNSVVFYLENDLSESLYYRGTCLGTIRIITEGMEIRIEWIPVYLQNAGTSDAIGPVTCESCNYIGDIETFNPAMGAYNDIICPKCHSTQNEHNRVYQKNLFESMRKMKENIS